MNSSSSVPALPDVLRSPSKSSYRERESDESISILGMWCSVVCVYVCSV
jgi:hypothetical protein